MQHDLIHEPTFGETLVQTRLKKLSNRTYSVHYEPQIMGSDGRTYKPDFVVISAKLGVLIIEVKDWITLRGGDQENIQIAHRDGQEDTFQNPVRVAERYAYALKDQFGERAELWEQRKRRQQLRFPWQVMVVLPNIPQQVIEQFEEKGIWPRHVVVGREHLRDHTAFEQAIHNLPWLFRLPKGLTADMLDIIRETLNPKLVLEDAQGNALGTITRIQEKLINDPVRIFAPQQLPLVPDGEEETKPAAPVESEIRLVRGVAGSGKTLVLIRRVRHLIEQYPDAKLLALTFNVEIAVDLKKRIAMPEGTVEVTNFHKLCRQILERQWQSPLKKTEWLQRHAAREIEQLKLTVEFVADELSWRVERGLSGDNDYLNADRKGRGYRLDRPMRETINFIFHQYQAFKAGQKRTGRAWYDWEDVPFLALEALENYPLKESFHAILIDEAQDFAPSWIQVVKGLLKPGGSLFLCDDPSQTIFQAYSWSQKSVQVVGLTTILRVPFRSTREISMAAHSLIEADDNLRQTEERPKPDFGSYEIGMGEMPLLIGYSDLHTEVMGVTQAVHRLLDREMPPQQIAILCQNRSQLSRWSHLEKAGVYVNYFEKMKGLEFNAVFVPTCTKRSRQPTTRRLSQRNAANCSRR